MYIVNVDHDKCDGCEECINVCPTAVFELNDNKSNLVNPDECVGCMSCVEACPNQAITVNEM